MNTNLSHDIPILRFCLLWVLATTIAATAALLLADFLVFWQYVHGTTEEIAFQNDNAVGPVFGFVFWVIILLGPSVGLTQALVLRRFARFVAWKAWWLTTSLMTPPLHLVALIASLLLSFILKGDRYMIIGLVTLPGLAFGLAQWVLLLTRNIKASSWWIWIAANVIACPLGVACGFLVTSTTGASYFANATYRFPFYPLQSAVYWALGWVVGAIIFSAFTSVVLVWLLRRHGSTPEAELAV